MTHRSLRIGMAAAALLVAAPWARAQVLTENFGTVANGIPTSTPGWVNLNHSDLPGAFTYAQGDTNRFNSQAGAANSFIGVNFNSTSGTTGTETISNWLLTPTIAGVQTGFQISFYTRTVDDPISPDRLEVRLSTNGSSTNVGTTSTAVGDFTTLLGTINPDLTTSGYPNTWTQFTYTVSGVDVPADGRFAFRYFAADGGPVGANSDYIGIDTMTITPVPEPTGLLVAGFAVTGLAWRWPRKAAAV